MRRRSHHGAARLARAREHQVVEFELGKLNAHAAGFVKEGELLGREIGGHFLDQQLGQMARVLGHLHHRAVARREDGDQPQKTQVDGKVPRHDDAHHAQGLGHHGVARAQKVAKVHGAALGLHPLSEVLEGVVHAIEHGEDFSKQGLVRGAVAVIGRDGGHDGIAVVAHQGLQLFQVAFALVQAGHGVCQISGTLPRQGVGQQQRGGHAFFAKPRRSTVAFSASNVRIAYLV